MRPLAYAAIFALLSSPGMRAQDDTDPVKAIKVPAIPSAAPQISPEDEGDVLYARGRYQAAIAAYQSDSKPGASLWNKMGIAYQMLFDQHDAEHCYRESLRIEPKNASVLNNLATIYNSQKLYPDAERMYRKALKLDPKSPVILKNLGTALFSEHKYAKGWEAYQAALAIDPAIFNHQGGPHADDLSKAGDRGAMNYYMARGCLRMGNTNCALDYLRLSLNEGFSTAKKLRADPEFAALRGTPEFENLLAAQGKS